MGIMDIVKYVMLVLILVIAVSIVGLILFKKYTEQNFDSKIVVNVERKITLEEISKHAVESDCWMAVDGGVFDVTEYVTSHPGGKLIVSGCGKDASEMFHNRPDREPDHSDEAVEILKKMQIGVLAD